MSLTDDEIRSIRKILDDEICSIRKMINKKKQLVRCEQSSQSRDFVTVIQDYVSTALMSWVFLENKKDMTDAEEYIIYKIHQRLVSLISSGINSNEELKELKKEDKEMQKWYAAATRRDPSGKDRSDIVEITVCPECYEFFEMKDGSYFTLEKL